MSRRLHTSLLLSMLVHMGLFVLAGSWIRHTLVDGGSVFPAGSVMMVEWVDSPEPAPAPTPVSSEPEEPSSIKEVGSPEADPGGTTAPGKRLDIDFERMAWIREVFARTLTYQRNAPKGFEGMVRSALSLHPSSAEGSAKISMRFDSSGTVRGVDIRSDSTELKTALGRVGWEAGPLPARYRIPCAGLNVNITVTGPNLSVGVEIL